MEELLTIFKISIATLCAKDEEAPHCNVTSYCGCTRPPDHRVANEIDLVMIFSPKILKQFLSVILTKDMSMSPHNTATQPRP